MDNPFKQHGAFSWCELMTTDVDAAKKFYTELLGWETEDMSTEGMAYTVIKAGGEGVGGIMTIPPQAQGAPPHWGAYVTVNDVDATAKKAGELGGQIFVAPTDIPDVGRFAVIQDPQGATLAIITYVDR
jgi:predicted enzyme related to lactoylglutathione lyase